MSWSSGKDSAYALQVARTAGDVRVTGLLTTVNAEFDRVAMHGVRRELLQAQADALGLPLHVVELPWPCPNEVYESRMAAAVAVAAAAGVSRMIFGDLFLTDIRSYREARLAGTGIEPVFPLWGRPTDALAAEMLDAGLSAVVSCVDPAQAPRSLAGRRFDQELLGDLAAFSPLVDPCGENGEFHTFVTAGPGFRREVPVAVGNLVERDGFMFADLLPVP
jgi:uncharacterized protein (TIGR00290 family)